MYLECQNPLAYLRGALAKLFVRKTFNPWRRDLERNRMGRCLDGDTILTTVREPVVLLDRQLRVQTASRSFLETFHVGAEETLHERFYDVGCGQWNFTEMHRLLHFGLRADGGGSREVIIEHDFERIGHRVLRINCCRLNQDTDNLILLAINELGPAQTYRRLFDSASDGLLIANAESGRIIDANQSTIHLLGFDREQLIDRLFWEVDPLIASPLGRDGFERVRAEGLVQFPVVGLHDKHGRFIETEVTGNIFDIEFAEFNFRDVTQHRRDDRPKPDRKAWASWPVESRITLTISWR